MSDRIAVMNNGIVLQIGSPKEIYEHPRTRFVADFIGETNFLNGTVSEISGSDVSVLVDGQVTVRAQSNDSLHQGQAVTVVIRPEKFKLDNSSDFKGRVEEIIYIGTDTRYLIRMTDKTRVTIREQNLDPEQMVDCRTGDEVGLSWNPSQALVLAE